MFVTRMKQNLRVAGLPFDSDRKLMSTIHKEAEGKISYCS
ncbi:hypothetical protein ACR31S_07785 [Streptococcus iniae]